MKIMSHEVDARALTMRGDHGPLLHSEGLYVGQRATGSNKRVLNLTRSAYLGQQRYATVTWSGDEDAGNSINIITRPLTDSELLGIFRGRQPDGIILLEILADDRRPQILRDHGFPFVMIGHRAYNTGLSFVDVDIEGGVDLAVEHLAGLGHREISFLTVDPVVNDKTYGFSTWALRAYEAACRRLGLVSRPSVGGPTDTAMTAAALRVIDENPGITAFIAPQQQSVIGVLKAARARSLRLPDDLSLVGMLSESMTGLTMPPLTTVDFPEDELGRIAARMILDQPDGGQTSPQQILLRPELIVRDSTSAPQGQPEFDADGGRDGNQLTLRGAGGLRST